MRPLTRAIVPVFGLCLMTAAASAEPSLDTRLNADATQMQALQQQIATGNAQLDGLKVAALFGESDEEKAAREAHEQNQDQGIANVNGRVGDMENSLRSLTGQVEQLSHRIQQLNDRLDRMQKDFDYKLCALSAQQLGVQTSGDNALPCNGAPQGGTTQSLGQGTGQGTGQGSSISGAVEMPQTGSVARSAPQSLSPRDDQASGPPQHLAPGPGTLGTLPSNAALPLPPPAGQGDMPAPVPVSHPEFDKAMSLLAKAQYDEALAAFQGYADKHADDALAPQALYWVGDIYFVQKDYPSALRALANGIKKYPSSARAPDSMLKLAETLIALDRKKEGCTALAALPSKYPTASKTVATKAAAERKALCTK